MSGTGRTHVIFGQAGGSSAAIPSTSFSPNCPCLNARRFFKSSYPAWGAVVSLKALLDEKIPSIVRIAKLDRDVSGTGRTIDEEMSKREKVHADLRRNSGKVQQSTIRWTVGDLDVSSSKSKDAIPDCRKILVVESRFGGKSLYFYRILAAEEYGKPEVLRQRAIQAAQLYLQRWQVETSYLRLKQDFGLEDARTQGTCVRKRPGDRE